MKTPIAETKTQFVRVVGKKMPIDNTQPMRGDFPDRIVKAESATQLVNRLIAIWKENRLADIIVVELPDETKWYYENKMFPDLLTKHMGKTTVPGQTMKGWVSLCMEHYNR